jgi:pyrroloquinoline quinone (PQQ) biosynthesis protein C
MSSGIARLPLETRPRRRNSLMVPMNIEVSPFFARLQEDVAAHPALHHSFLERFRHEPLGRGQLASFAAQHYLYSRLFTRNLAAVIANVPDEHARSLLIENMYEEVGEPARIRDRLHLLLLEAGIVQGWELARAMEELVALDIDGDVVQVLLRQGIVTRPQIQSVLVRNTRRAQDLTHPALFRRFLEALGLDAGGLRRVKPLVETERFIAEYQDVCRNGAWLEAMGAMGPGTECVVPTLYSSILRGIEASGIVSREKYVFWTLHVHCDDGHGRNIVSALAPYAEARENQRAIVRGALRVLDARKCWFDALERHVFAAGGRS